MDRQNYIFTFGCGHIFAGKYVKIYGTYTEAREKMFEMFGDKWAFQYSEEEWNALPLPNHRRETELDLTKTIC